MPLHFGTSEFTARISRAQAALEEAGLDAILLFAPESHLWLSGYDTFGFAMFQCMVLGADGRIDLLTRAPDLRQARHTSILGEDQIHIWMEVEGATPAQDLARLLASRGMTGKRIGWETQTPGLTTWNGDMVRAAIPNLIEASDVIRACRRVKSPAEIAMHRRAAALSDDALDAALETTRAGASRAIFSQRCKARSLRAAAIMRGTSLFSGPAPALCCVDIIQDDGRWMRRTN